MTEYFTLTNLFYCVCAITLVILLYHFNKSNKQIIPSSNKSSTNFSSDKKVEIPDFDKKEYLRQLFNNTFYSITNDSGWVSRYWSSSVTFTKHEDRKKKNSYDDIPYITLDIKFDFKPEMYIREATLKSGYDTYTYDGRFDYELLDYIYKEYKIFKDKENQEALEKIEKSVKNINGILGKGVERGSKLNDLLD